MQATTKPYQEDWGIGVSLGEYLLTRDNTQVQHKYNRYNIDLLYIVQMINGDLSGIT